MRDSGTSLRKGYINALNGQLSLNSVNVPVVDGKVEDMPATGLFVVIGGQTDTDKSNKANFVYETTLDMAVVNKRKSSSSKKDVEDISDQILQIIRPTPIAIGVAIDAPFNITYIRYTTGIAENVVTDAANQIIQVKRLQFVNRITQ